MSSKRDERPSARSVKLTDAKKFVGLSTAEVTFFPVASRAVVWSNSLEEFCSECRLPRMLEFNEIFDMIILFLGITNS